MVDAVGGRIITVAAVSNRDLKREDDCPRHAREREREREKEKTKIQQQQQQRETRVQRRVRAYPLYARVHVQTHRLSFGRGKAFSIKGNFLYEEVYMGKTKLIPPRKKKKKKKNTKRDGMVLGTYLTCFNNNKKKKKKKKKKSVT